MDSPTQGGEEFHHSTHKPKGPLAVREEEILKFWNKEGIFKKSLQKPAPRGEFIFYDGPPFASGLPHYGNVLAGTIKDAIPRYRTMRGYHVPRRWGWDCHGLPVENLVEKELGFKTKRDIEAFGIAKFNEAARTSIMKDVADWKRIIPRMGRWADMEHDYKTMDPGYTESVWWAFKNLYDRGLIYEGFKAMHLCPRCGTTLSNFEVAQGYQDIEDIAVTVKLPLVDEPGTSLLIWTTTPWTLPGNAAAAVNAAATYVKVKVGEEYVIASAEYFSKKSSGSPQTFSQNIPPPHILQEFLGKELVGKKYEPPFDYFKDELHKHKTHAWKVYAAPYVTLDSGTGIVHLAPAYGADDLELAQKEKIPLIHHVTGEGKFMATVRDFAGLPVKPKGRHRETDAKIVEHLHGRGLLFAQEKVSHPYPHCWRCDTPLLNWVANSWFVAVSKIKKKLLAENKNIDWVPEHIGGGRFKNGIEQAPDWAISRSRYWGAPLPVWRNSKTKEIKVAGSVADLLGLARRSGNVYFVMRHGQAENNVAGIIDSSDTSKFPLTEQGEEEARTTGAQLKREGIDMVIFSPLTRTAQTARLVQKELGLPESALMPDERLREVQTGEYDGRRWEEWETLYSSYAQRLEKAPPGGETFADIRRRVGDFLFELERRYTGKKILIVTHNAPAWLLHGVTHHYSLHDRRLNQNDEGYLLTGQAKKLPFVPFPHNADYELDLHRPYIDEVVLGDSVSGEWKRVPDVFDCWFESGSMPFASNHYPFAKDAFNPKRIFGLLPKGYPADFIAEGLDQCRGWFYSLIVLGTALFGRSPYKNVIVNGLVLAQDGAKMSKRLKNYPDPMDVVDKFGADALRYYLLSSSVARGEDLNFSLRGVEEVSKKILMRLDNVRSFYELYAPAKEVEKKSSANVLDRWILARLSTTVSEITRGYEEYELDEATRPLAEFVDDLSTWYLRRSRARFKPVRPGGHPGREEGEDTQSALATLRRVLYVTAHMMAPAMPFFAESLFLAVRQGSDPESVHLGTWPELSPPSRADLTLIADMREVRAVTSLGLEAREKASIKIRQPLAMLKVRRLLAQKELYPLIQDELNVKAVLEDTTLGEEVWLNTTLTPELREEGMVRDWVRAIQSWRKEQGITIADRPRYTLAVASKEEKEIAEKHRAELVAATGLGELEITHA